MACTSVLTQEERLLQQLRTALFSRDDRLPELFFPDREQRQLLQLLQQQLLRQLEATLFAKKSPLA